MTEEERRVLEKWRRRAHLFRQAYREAELEAGDLKVELALKTHALQKRMGELEAEAESTACT